MQATVDGTDGQEGDDHQAPPHGQQSKHAHGMSRLIRIGWLLAVSAVYFAGDAGSQEPPGHSMFHDWYQQLRQPGTNRSCCSLRDCRPVPYKVVPSGVVLSVGGKWIQVPRERLIESETPDDGAHWCGIGESWDKPTTYCAIIPRSAV
jgi:hypothetical protein